MEMPTIAIKRNRNASYNPPDSTKPGTEQLKDHVKIPDDIPYIPKNLPRENYSAIIGEKI